METITNVLPVTNQESVKTVPVATENVQPTEAVPELDLITKVTQFKRTQPKVSEITNAPEQPEFEAIKDPVAKEAAKQAVERMRRGFQSEYAKKTEEAQKLIEQSKTWSPQRIQQELLSNPDFLNAAQQIASVQNPPNSGLTADEYSALTEREKVALAQVPELKSQIDQLKQTNASATYQAAVQAKDAELQARFPDYNPTQVNDAMARLAAMSPVEVREFVYKAMNHDAHAKDVYEMGKQEGRGLTQDKINAVSPIGVASTNNDGVPTKEKGETDQNFFLRLGQFRLAQSRKR